VQWPLVSSPNSLSSAPPKYQVGANKEPSVSIFVAAFDALGDRWIAFNEDTPTSLSEHDTEAEALEACRRYTEREMRRANILHDCFSAQLNPYRRLL
jgi:hypothetical protein